MRNPAQNPDDIDRDIQTLINIQTNLQEKTKKKIKDLYHSHHHLYDPLSDMQVRIKERKQQTENLKQQLRDANQRLLELEKRGDAKDNGKRVINIEPKLGEIYNEKQKDINQKLNKVKKDRQKLEDQIDSYIFFLIRVIDELSKPSNNTYNLPISRPVLQELTTHMKDIVFGKQQGHQLTYVTKRLLDTIKKKGQEGQQREENEGEEAYEAKVEAIRKEVEKGQIEKIRAEIKKKPEEAFEKLACIFDLQEQWKKVVQQKNDSFLCDRIQNVIKQQRQADEEKIQKEKQNIQKQEMMSQDLEQDIKNLQRSNLEVLQKILGLYNPSASLRDRFNEFKGFHINKQLLEASAFETFMKNEEKQKRQNSEVIQNLKLFIKNIYEAFFRKLFNLLDTLSAYNHRNQSELGIAFTYQQEIANQKIQTIDWNNLEESVKNTMNGSFRQIRRQTRFYNYQEMELLG